MTWCECRRQQLKWAKLAAVIQRARGLQQLQAVLPWQRQQLLSEECDSRKKYTMSFSSARSVWTRTAVPSVCRACTRSVSSALTTMSTRSRPTRSIPTTGSLHARCVARGLSCPSAASKNCPTTSSCPVSPRLLLLCHVHLSRLLTC